MILKNHLLMIRSISGILVASSIAVTSGIVASCNKIPDEFGDSYEECVLKNYNKISHDTSQYIDDICQRHFEENVGKIPNPISIVDVKFLPNPENIIEKRSGIASI